MNLILSVCLDLKLINLCLNTFYCRVMGDDQMLETDDGSFEDLLLHLSVVGPTTT